jgi:hypothetical protein
MVNNINTIQEAPQEMGRLLQTPRLLPRDLRIEIQHDRVEFGGGAPLSKNNIQDIILERSMEKLRAVVSDARAQLNLPEDAVIDTSPQATANRIADFALGFFGQYAENNGLEDNEEGRAQFAQFIGDAIHTGIEEARDILGALKALNPEVSDGIEATAQVIQTRLDDFITNGLV